MSLHEKVKELDYEIALSPRYIQKMRVEQD